LEKLIHVPEGQLVLSISELAVVAAALKQDKLLIGALVGNSLAYEANHEFHVEMNSGEIILTVLISNGRISTEAARLTGGLKLFSDGGGLLDLVLD